MERHNGRPRTVFDVSKAKLPVPVLSPDPQRLISLHSHGVEAHAHEHGRGDAKRREPRRQQSIVQIAKTASGRVAARAQVPTLCFSVLLKSI